ncbi:hypothetical protein SK128_010487, partial [Halocaridina rubra]
KLFLNFHQLNIGPTHILSCIQRFHQWFATYDLVPLGIHKVAMEVQELRLRCQWAA